MRRLAALTLIATLIAAGCAESAADGDASPPRYDPDRELTGYRRDPPPEVGALTLPDLARGGEEVALRADEGELLVVYFGFTNCPDFCPTTLSDLRLATKRMTPADAARIDVAMITVDPDRDLPVLADYITSFFESAHALGTDDASRLAEVAAPFGVGYQIDEGPDGEIEVAHTTALYAIDDEGELALTWQFGVSIDELAADLVQLLGPDAS